MKQTYFGYEYKGVNIYRTRKAGYTYYRIEGERDMYTTLKQIKQIIDNK